MDNNDDVSTIFTSLYSEHAAWSRHQESQRSSISNLIITITAISVGLISYDNKIDISDIPFSIFIVLIGLFGIIFVYKYYVQFKYHDSRVEAYKNQLNSIVPNADILDIEKKSDNDHRGKYSLFSKLNLYQIWMVFHGFIVIAGLALSVGAYCTGKII